VRKSTKTIAILHTYAQSASVDLRLRQLIGEEVYFKAGTLKETIMALFYLCLYKSEVFVSKNYSMKALIICIVARIFHRKIHYDICDYPLQSINAYLNIKELFILWLNAAILKCSNVVTVSCWQLAQCVQNCTNKNIVILYDAVNPGNLVGESIQTINWAEKERFKKARNTICWFGSLQTLSNNKNDGYAEFVNEVVSALEDFIDFTMTLVTIESELSNHIISKFNRRLGENRVVLIPWSWENQDKCLNLSEFAYLPSPRHINELFKSTGRIDYAVARGCRVISGMRFGNLEKYINHDNVYFGSLQEGLKYARAKSQTSY
jgi:hypothetical protein